MIINWIKSIIFQEQTSKKEKLISGAIAFGYIFTLGYAGNLWNEQRDTFYNSLIKPDNTPPDALFSVVWLLLFIAIGFSGYWAWNHFQSKKYRQLYTILYFINGIFVFLWPTLFFGKQDINSALYLIVALILLVEVMILTAFKVNRKSAYLLVPYLLWLFFAAYLNIGFVVLNG